MIQSPSGQANRSRELLISYGLFALVAAILALAFAAPTFRVSRIEVIGSGISSSQVAAATGVKGQSVFTIRGSTILADLQRVPNILVTGVSVSLPGTVTVRSRLRRAIFGWRQQGALFLIDQYGRLIAQTSATTLPTIENDTPKLPALGGYAPEDLVVDASYVLQQINHGGIGWFSVGVRKGVVIHSREGWKAVLGRPTGQSLRKRVATLRTILSKTRPSSQHLRLVDVRSQSPYVSFRVVPTPTPQT